MKVAMLPRSPWGRANPYLELLESGLRQSGVETVDDPNDALSWAWLLRQRGSVNVLHFHWLQYHYDRPTAFASSWALAKFLAKVLLARVLGYRLIWTVHNLQPHEQRYPWLDRMCRLSMTRSVHQIIVHCDRMRDQVSVLFGRQHGVHVLPPPNYTNVYPASPTQGEARRRLGFDEKSMVFLSFGAIRPYKGFQDAIMAFGKIPDKNARLIIAGRPLDDCIAQEISVLVQADARILAVLSYVPDVELATYLSAADVVVLPFRKVDTTSSAVLAMSVARPVIAPALGCLPELITKETGILYEPGNCEALGEAMRRCAGLDLKAMGRQAYLRVAPSTPGKVAAEHLVVYKEALKRR